jgi:hypothetical protein
VNILGFDTSIWQALFALAFCLPLIAFFSGAAPLKPAALLISSLLLPLPLSMASSLPLIKFLLAFSISLIFLKTIDLLRDKRVYSFRQRLLHLVFLWDSREGQPIQPMFKSKIEAEAIAWFFVSSLMMWLVVSHFLVPANTVEFVIKSVAGAILIYAGFESLTRQLEVLAGCIGIQIPVLHDAPIKSTSIREFWGDRWNRIIGNCLKFHLYSTFRKKDQKLLGSVAVFTGSAILHWYQMYCALDFKTSLVMASFFFVQIILLFAENLLYINKRTTAVARTWTIAMILVTSPLFTWPMFELVG